LEGWGHGLRRKGGEEGGWRVEEPVAEGPIKIVPDVESRFVLGGWEVDGKTN